MFSDLTYDACSQAPSHRVPLDQVSIFHQRIHLSCQDPNLGEVSGLFSVRAGVSLGEAQRGIHMSRIEAAFRDVPGGLTLVEAALHLARELRRVQDQAGAEVSLVGSIPFNRRTRVTSQLSPGTLRLSARATVSDVESSSLGLGLDIMTCCPCMQAYALEEIARYADLTVDDPREVMSTVPIATHSQKGTVVARVRGPAAVIAGLTFGQLYEALASAVHPTGELLKRPDEYDLVRRAHLKPQFVEDVVREVVVAMGTACSGLPDRAQDEVKISVAAASMESIHGHDIAARKTITLAALRALLVASR